MSLTLSSLLNPIWLMPHTTPQVCYALLTINAVAAHTWPIHWAVLVDASPSMRIPILREEDFRTMVKQGGAREVLVDGIPVWQIEGEVPPEIRANAPSALEYAGRALHSLMERLNPSDQVALVACADRAHVVVAGASGAERHRVALAIGQLKGLQLGDQTDLSRGMRAALTALADHRGDQAAVERILLLTDGFTLFPEACERLASEAATAGVAVSTLGLGSEFHEGLLLRLADLSGGQAQMLHSPEDLWQAISNELNAARRVAARALEVRIQLPQTVQLRRVTRLSPSLAPLTPQQEADGRSLLHLGDLPADTPARLLLELIAPPLPQRAERQRLALIEARSGSEVQHLDLIGHYRADPPAAPLPLRNGIARAAVVQQQERARHAQANGDLASAAGALTVAAQHLERLGEAELAAATRREAAALAAGTRDAAHTKALTYATRRLGEDAP